MKSAIIKNNFCTISLQSIFNQVGDRYIYLNSRILPYSLPSKID